MAGLSPAEVAQLYNGIYDPPVQGPAPLPTMTVEEMYRGIYPAAPAAAPTPPKPPSPPTAPTAPAYDVYRGIYGPANLSSEIGLFPNIGSLFDLFPGSSQTKTETVAPAAPNGLGYQAGMVKEDNERLLPSALRAISDMFGQGPTTRRVQSVPVPQQASVPMPRARPAGIASMYAAPAAPSQREPLRIAVSGANRISPTAPTPAPASQRPAAPTSLYYTNPIAFGQQSVAQSGDTSSGSQAEAAAARASGDGGRIRRY